MEKDLISTSVSYKACSNIKNNKNMLGPRYNQILLLFILCVVLSACMPLKDENINTELFTSKEEMIQRTDELQRGMHKEDAFTVLGVPRERFTAMSTAEIQTAVYGNSLVQGTPAQLEEFRNRLLNYEGYSLPYRQLESTGSLGFAKMKVDKSGHDLRLVMVFDHGRLMKADVVGEEEYKSSEDQYFWSNLIKTGVGTVF